MAAILETNENCESEPNITADSENNVLQDEPVQDLNDSQEVFLSQSDKSITIVEVQVVDKEPSEKEVVDEKASTKKGNTAAKISAGKNVKKVPGAKVPENKLSTGKVGLKKSNVDNKLTSPRPTKVTSKLADYIKQPVRKEAPGSADNKKLSKNAVNQRKASMPDVKRTSITVMPVSVAPAAGKDRRLSAPVSAKSDGGSDDAGKPPIKRNPPKSKWDNIMSGINSGKDAAKTKARTDVKSRQNVAKTPAKTNSNSEVAKRTAKPEVKKTNVSPKPRTGE